jgi:riboflavin kinase/FMN adenylyltransferase
LFTATGTIQEHAGRGAQLGYPTLNIPLTSPIEYGVYAGYVRYQSTPLPAAIFVGPAVSFGETEPQIEAHILDWEGRFPVTTVFIEGHQRIRENQKFSTAEALRQQIANDITQVRLCLQELSKKSSALPS